MTGAVLPHPTTSTEALVADVAEHGYGVLESLLDAEQTRDVRDRLVALAATERESGTDSSYHRGANQRVYALPAHHQVFVDLASHPVVLDVVTSLIGPDPILSNLSANIAGPGGRMQTVHADQGFLPEPWSSAWAVQVVWMLDDFTEANGATRVVPGSHRLAHRPERAVPYVETTPICGTAGSVVVFDARCWHGTGVYEGEDVRPEDRRHALLGFYTLPFLRQQENWALSLPREVWAGRADLARLFGITPWQHLGLVNGNAVPLDA